MKNKRKHRAPFQEHSFWQSYSDMMAALLLTFVLIIAITLSIYRQKTSDLALTREELNTAQTDLEAARADLDRYRADLEAYEADLKKHKEEIEASNAELERSLAELQAANAHSQMTQNELDKAYAEIDRAQSELSATKNELQNIVGIRTDIISDLQNTFSNSSMQVEPQTGSITFSSDVLFRYNSSTLTKDSQQTLKEIIPLYLDVLLQDNYRPHIAEIIIEGHTDTDGSYQGNMSLSYDRANAVAVFCQNSKNGLTEEKIEQLRELLTVNGRSYSDPVYQTGSSTIDMAASRRVEIKFRLREDEMIQKITNILNQ